MVRGPGFSSYCKNSLPYAAELRGGPAMNREGKPVSAARIRNASADLKEIQSRV